MDRHATEELLEPFLSALVSKSALQIPQETVLGAITHFLSTLPQAELPRFTTAILESDYLWASDDYNRFSLGQAVALAVSAKVGIWERRHKTHWFASRKVSSACCRWLDKIVTTIGTSGAQNLVKLEFQAGLLAGMAANEQIAWGNQKMDLEEPVILGVSELALSTAGQRELAIVCEVVHHVEATRLLILDLQVSSSMSPIPFTSLII
jgi:hypothetical protein